MVAKQKKTIREANKTNATKKNTHNLKQQRFMKKSTALVRKHMPTSSVKLDTHWTTHASVLQSKPTDELTQMAEQVNVFVTFQCPSLNESEKRDFLIQTILNGTNLTNTNIKTTTTCDNYVTATELLTEQTNTKCECMEPVVTATATTTTPMEIVAPAMILYSSADDTMDTTNARMSSYLSNKSVTATVTTSSSNKTHKSKKQNIPAQVKRDVWAKYCGNNCVEHLCFCCEIRTVHILNFHCGHVISEYNNGTMAIDNLRPVCSGCNLSMGIRNMWEYKNMYYSTA